MNALITGSSGFIGTALARRLLADGHKVVGIDLKPSKNTDHPTFAFDISIQYLPEFIQTAYDIDTVFHLGAITTLAEAEKHPLCCFRANLDSTLLVLESARALRIPKVVVASSDQIYTPQNFYALSKQAADTAALIFAETHDLNVSVLRCCNVYGPGDYNHQRLVPATILKALRGETPIIYQSHAVKDLLFIDDLLDAYLKLAGLEARGAFCASGTGLISVTDIVKLILKLSGSDLVPEVRPRALKEPTVFHALDSSSLQALGWLPRINLEDGLKKTIEWYRAQL